MTSFICATCGKSHDGLPTDQGWRLPDEVWAIAEPERSRRAKFNSDLCEFEGRCFIRCLLMIPFNEQPDYFGWGVWVELSQTVFDKYVELYDKDGSNEPAVAGVIANKIPGYPTTRGLEVSVQFQNNTSRPLVHLLPHSGHPLVAEQSAGINNARYHQIIDSLGAARGS